MSILNDIINMYSDAYNVLIEHNNISIKLNNFIIKKDDLDINFNIETNNEIIFLNNILKVDQNNNNIETQLLCNKIKKENFVDIAEFIEYLCRTTNEIKNYCISCGNKLSFTSDIFTTCGSEKCKYKLEEHIVDNDVYEFIKKYPTTTRLLLNIASYAIRSNKSNDLLDPFPPYFLKDSFDIERGKLAKLNMDIHAFSDYNSQKDFVRLRNTFNHIVSFDFDKIINTPSDKLICQNYGNDFYYLLRFIIKSCKLEITLDKIEENVSIYKIKNPFIDEEAFKNKIKENNNKKCYLFHGSSDDCWYSILRNGLKVLSGSKLQLNGAAYGKGIYMSNLYSMSRAYCKTTNPIVAVYEVCGDSDLYKKQTSIYVIPSNDNCILRYLIVGNITDQTILKHISTMFETTIVEEKQNNEKMLEKGKKKLMKELEVVKKTNFNINLVNNQINKWQISNSKATIEIIFPELYPFEPPFVYIKKPLFTIESKYISSDGALCLETLTPAIWSPTISIENLIVQIFSLIIEPAIKLSDNEYDYTSAKKSYEKIAIGNGWIN